MSYFDKAGWRAAGTPEERVKEAAEFFGKNRRGNPIKQAELVEAFTTSDFPVLLGNAFQAKAIAAQKAAVNEFEPILATTTAPDFERRKLVDLWSSDAFQRVGQGEEYKAGKLKETDLWHGTEKWGLTYGLTFELRLRRMFSDLAKFPTFLGNGAVRAKNNAVADLLVKNGAWNGDFFGSVASVNFTPEALDGAIKDLALREDHRGDQVEIGSLYLVHGSGLRGEVNRILNASKLVMESTNGTRKTNTEVENPFRGIVTPLESRTIGKALGGNQSKAWALVQGKDGDLPSIIDTGLEGHDGNVDIRVKRDQGEHVGGGQVPVDEGSFNDDTIHYRGRTFFGIDKGFTEGVWASNGAA